jgi:RNA polymerase sigma factor (sigma-70 family)
MTDPDFRNAFYAQKDVLYRFVYRMTGSANGAEDIVQECFLALWRKPDAYDANRGALRAFLLGIARNLVLKRWRDDHPHDPIEEDSFICGPVDLLSQERAEMVAQAVQMLPPLQRESIILAEYEDLTLEEIASATASTVAGAKSIPPLDRKSWTISYSNVRTPRLPQNSARCETCLWLTCSCGWTIFESA